MIYGVAFSSSPKDFARDSVQLFEEGDVNFGWLARLPQDFFQARRTHNRKYPRYRYKLHGVHAKSSRAIVKARRTASGGRVLRAVIALPYCRRFNFYV